MPAFSFERTNRCTYYFILCVQRASQGKLCIGLLCAQLLYTIFFLHFPSTSFILHIYSSLSLTRVQFHIPNSERFQINGRGRRHNSHLFIIFIRATLSMLALWSQTGECWMRPCRAWNCVAQLMVLLSFFCALSAFSAVADGSRSRLNTYWWYLSWAINLNSCASNSHCTLLLAGSGYANGRRSTVCVQVAYKYAHRCAATCLLYALNYNIYNFFRLFLMCLSVGSFVCRPIRILFFFSFCSTSSVSVTVAFSGSVKFFLRFFEKGIKK